MIWQIACGILLGWLLIQAWPDIIKLANGILNAISDFVCGIFSAIGKCCRWFWNLRWYIKLLIFIVLTYVLCKNDLINAWICVVLVYSFMIAVWIDKTIRHLSDKTKEYAHEITDKIRENMNKKHKEKKTKDKKPSVKKKTTKK